MKSLVSWVGERVNALAEKGAKAFGVSLRDERGAVNMQGFIFVAIGLIMVAVGFIIFPIVVTGTDAILSYADGALSNHVFTAANFTGLTSVAALTPLLVLLGFIVSTVLVGFMGVQTFRGAAEYEGNPAQYLLLGVGMIFIAVALIIFPILLDGIVSAWDAVLDSTYSAQYTGLTGFIPIAPLLALVGTIFIGVVSEYFGIKKSMTGSFT